MPPGSGAGQRVGAKHVPRAPSEVRKPAHTYSLDAVQNGLLWTARRSSTATRRAPITHAHAHQLGETDHV